MSHREWGLCCFLLLCCRVRIVLLVALCDKVVWRGCVVVAVWFCRRHCVHVKDGSSCTVCIRGCQRLRLCACVVAGNTCWSAETRPATLLSGCRLTRSNALSSLLRLCCGCCSVCAAFMLCCCCGCGCVLLAVLCGIESSAFDRTRHRVQHIRTCLIYNTSSCYSQQQSLGLLNMRSVDCVGILTRCNQRDTKQQHGCTSTPSQ